MPVDVRAAGARTLLFGLPSERIRNLTADQLTQDDQHTYLAAGRHPILLPPRLAGLLQRLATQPQERLMISHDRRGPRRLFPRQGPRAAGRQPRPDHQAEPARNQRPAGSQRSSRRPRSRPARRHPRRPARHARPHRGSLGQLTPDATGPNVWPRGLPMSASRYRTNSSRSAA